MKIPKIIKVGGHDIHIEFQKLDEDNGHFDYETDTITISTDLSKSQKEATLIHEILHVLNSTLSSDNYGHSFLDSLAEQLYQVLKDNELCFHKKIDTDN